MISMPTVSPAPSTSASVPCAVASSRLGLGLAIALSMGSAWAQDKVYRCGNEYTNAPTDIAGRGCKLVEGTNFTVVQSRPAASAGASAGAPRAGASTSGARASDTAEQRARDSDSRVILDEELRKSQERLATLKAEYAGGEPERRGEEFRNPQRYADRVAEMKASMNRTESDIAGLKREIARLPGGAALPATASFAR